jgi:hypothetical protein
MLENALNPGNIDKSLQRRQCFAGDSRNDTIAEDSRLAFRAFDRSQS